MDWSKLGSRKLIATVLTIALVVGANLLGLPLDESSLEALVTMVLGYVGSQGLVDTASAWKTGQAIAGGVKAVKDVADKAKLEDDPTDTKAEGEGQ